MRIEIIAIGNEIISGNTINSNASFISQKLKENGYSICRHLALPDDQSVLAKELKAAFDGSDVVICCGGLGPTIDDLTKATVAKLFNLELQIDDKIKANLKQRFPGYSAIERDASVPKEATPIMNMVGTAPGIVIERDSKSLILLPGVPSELKLMLDENVIPFLIKKYPVNQRVYQKKIGIFLAFETDIDPILKKFQAQYPNLEIGIYPNLGYVIVSVAKALMAKDSTHQDVDTVISAIRSTFFESIFEVSIEKDLHNELIAKKYKVAFAESCTGGAIAAAMTRLPGASNYLEGALVTYSNEMKIKHLHVNKNTLHEYGAVSKEVVEEMLRGLLDTTSADYVIATSGIAGPSGGTDKKPVGSVCIGCADKNLQKDIYFIHIQGPREKIIEETVNTALAVLLRRVKYNAYTFRK